MKNWLKRFIIGFLSACIIPIAKLYQNGIDINQLNIKTMIGCSIPVVLMSLCVALYAVFIENGEKDMRKLFKLCVLLPGAFVAFSGGKSKNIIPVVNANPPVIEMKCKPISSIQQGIQSTLDSLSNKIRVKYWLLSDSKKSKEYILIKDKKYFIINKLAKKPEKGIIFDLNNCQIIK